MNVSVDMAQHVGARQQFTDCARSYLVAGVNPINKSKGWRMCNENGVFIQERVNLAKVNRNFLLRLFMAASDERSTVLISHDVIRPEIDSLFMNGSNLFISRFQFDVIVIAHDEENGHGNRLE